MNFSPESRRKPRLAFLFERILLATLAAVSLTVPIAAGTDDVKQVSDDPKSLVKQAEKLQRRGELAAAEDLYKRAVLAAPNNSEYKLKLAYLYVKMRRLIDAYDLSYPIAKSEPKNSFAFAVVGAT